MSPYNIGSLVLGVKYNYIVTVQAIAKMVRI
jgi:hypothetical protein